MIKNYKIHYKFIVSNKNPDLHIMNLYHSAELFVFVIMINL